ncbi:hypothetical protein B0O80DRAFT_500673 [Mortierella sp. GBAus27b]|nr:hypothetical protein BGX31_008763 [Mortierella sp. GBA43]KAI8350466.1 hypothetical protein B0O80DRAFT_500673 [Mortierella sp. GBAus27b]
MSLALKINPVEIPELLHIIGCHLSDGDQKTCMLVSRKWCNLFRAYYWKHLYFNRQGIPNLDKYGHLVRRLTTFWTDDKDLVTISGSCHLVQHLELELGQAITNIGLDTLMSNLPHIQELSLRVPHWLQLKHLVMLTQQKRLQRLRILSPEGYRAVSFDWTSLIVALQECPTLSSLYIDGLTEDGEDGEYMEPNEPEKVASRPLPRPSSVVGRWVQKLTSRSHSTTATTPRRRSLPPELLAKEPWRKFVRDTTINIPNKIPESLQNRQLDDTKIYVSLTQLHVSRLRIDSSLAIPIGILFEKSPYLQDLHMDFGHLSREHVGECLDAIMNNCYGLQTLVMEGLVSNPSTNSTIHTFFQQSRPTLRNLKLKHCTNIQLVLDLIPNTTVATLERVCFDSSIYSHPAIHRFLARSSSLQYFTWTVPSPREIPPLKDRLDAFVEPWACYETIRHVDQRNCIVDDASYEAFFGRLALMPRLVSLSISIDDLKRLMANIAAVAAESNSYLKGGRQSQEKYLNREGGALGQGQRHITSTPGSIEDDDEQESSTMDAIQELTFSAIPVAEFSRLLLSKQVNTTEIVEILRVFPRLRKIRYEGTIFPLDQGARAYMESIKAKHISILHVSQLPSSVF